MDRAIWTPTPPDPIPSCRREANAGIAALGDVGLDKRLLLHRRHRLLHGTALCARGVPFHVPRIRKRRSRPEGRQSGGGFAAMLVAIFPTCPPANVPAPAWFSSMTSTIHYLAATTMFLVFIFFSVFLFRKTKASKPGEMSPGKRRRNHVYLWCGIIMFISVLWAGSSLFTDAPIFWPESIALSAFSVSWLVKGKADRLVIKQAKRVLGR